ncbi:tryptophan--tRNA ligase [Pseudoleptotrichia goodfellowii]|uniref:Tryptophan--tRNA ligase n=1 Tax=Pseudoleptotrichia goodfellowii F0264 TaxID=596323 RepID=D0GLT7_9FUSO|nr:tryptophan--tRNA ligase [Pseudoleptotrichia goodfellowii]EEY34890.1 tryptophan--tRNA ligase [Pseudoleptotrichia goodfellowii F0264]
MRSLSGIQPSGNLHIGNYFGAIKQFVEFQDKYEGLYFLANYHALTSSPKGEDLKRNTVNAILDYLALGLDPEKSIIFLQSDVPEHTELSWILANVAPMGLLERAHSYKDKTAKGIKPNVGLFTYPILMAADILMYDPDVVPVGKDQKQHVEITRDIAIKFNETYGKEVFKLPEEKIVENVAVVPGVDGDKMSKSYGNVINMFIPKKEIKKQIMGIVTDSTPLEEPKNPDNNITKLYSLLATEAEVEEMKRKFSEGNYGYGHAKNELFEKFIDYFNPFIEKREKLEKNIDYVYDVLKEGAFKARSIAQKKMEEVRSTVGLLKI